MSISMLFLLALGLSMDAFSVSLSNGIVYRGLKIKGSLAIGMTFGFFQALMPVIGFYATRSFENLISNVDHYIALIILSIIGIKMIIDAVKDLKNKDEEKDEKNLTLKLLIIQGIATSIDALAVGISFAAIKVDIYIAAMLIGIITFTLSTMGVFIGKKFGSLLKEKAEILGGVILIFIGLKIFIEHMIK